MTLRDRFEEESGEGCLQVLRGHITGCYTNEYVYWLEDQLTWKKVEDRLPEHGVEVLIQCEGENEDGFTSMVTTGSLGTKAWITPLDEWYSEEEIKVNYWLPIPKIDV